MQEHLLQSITGVRHMKTKKEVQEKNGISEAMYCYKSLLGEKKDKQSG